MSDITRLTGLASGLDVDALVKSMTKADTTRVDKAKQDKQIVQWKQDMYRDIIGDFNTFKSTYFDVLKSDTNMLSSGSYSSFDITSSDTSNSILSVSASGSSVIEGTYAVRVEQLAAGASIEGNSLADGTSYSTKLSDLGITSDTLNITYNDGTDHNITVDVNSSMTLSDLKNTISEKSSGNINLSFSELTGKLILKTAVMGDGVTISATDSTIGDTLSKLGLNTVAKIGVNAVIYVKQPGADVETKVDSKKTNSFLIDGINYKLSSADSSKTINISVAENVDKTYDKIKGFVDKYNEIIDKINTKVSEKKQYSYLPLTDDQKKDMKDTEITAWEDKAKQGLLKGDSNLQNMLYNLRSCFYETVKGAGISLTEIGLSTSADVSQGGKIIIDEAKLKDSIKTKGDQIQKLFMKTSEDIPSYDPDLSNSDRNTRKSQEGIFQRINDILQDNLRTVRNNNGKKGTLLEKAGVKGDYTEYNNLLTNQLNDEDKVISKLVQKLSDDEDKYYNQFSKLEVAMQKLNDQSSWLTQQLGSSS